MTGRLLLALALTAAPAWAQEGSDLAPESAPAPPARPEVVEGEEPGGVALPEEEPAGEEADAEQPMVEESTEGAGELPEAGDRPALIPPEGMTPEETSAGEDEADSTAPTEEREADEVQTGEDSPEEEPAGPSQPEALTETPEELAGCLAELDALGVVYERTGPISGEGNPDCGIANPLIVTGIAPGVAFEPPSTMRCATALAGARWAADVVVPLSRRLGRGDLVAIDQGTSYLCRPRADGAMSEHAWGNALDVMGFRFSDGDPLPVQPRAGDGTLEEAFQRAVRAGACLDFPTVLGPGSDADHADHLHLDIKSRDAGFRICE